MSFKKILKPSIKKLAFFIILLIIEFFALPILALRSYSPKLGAEYVPIYTYCSLFNAFTDESLGSCNLFVGSYIYLLIAIILTYIIACVVIHKIFDRK